MIISHFIVNSVSGVLIAICGEAIAPRQLQGSAVGQKDGATVCSECATKAHDAWVTFVLAPK